MAQNKINLTEEYIKSVKLAPGRVMHWDEKLPGFGLRVGARDKTFVLVKRVAGKVTRITLGHHGEDRKDRSKLSVAAARKAAENHLRGLNEGKSPNAKPSGTTLQEALDMHLARMAVSGGKGEGKGEKPCSSRSIKTLENDVSRHLADWLDKPFETLTRAELRKIYVGILADAKPRLNQKEEPKNPPGAGAAKRIVAHVSALWTTANEELDDGLPFRNPKFKTAALAPKEQRIENHELPGWYADVQTLSPVRRDFQLLCLFTGVRSEGARLALWDDIDWEKGVFHIRQAKGNRPYSVPLGPKTLAMLRKRKADNAVLFADYEGDHGFIFPTLTRSKPYEVIPMEEAKEYRKGKKFLPGPQPSRATYNSIAMEIGIGREDRETLMNHEGRGVNAKHYGFRRDWDQLVPVQTSIEAALWARIAPKKKSAAKRRNKKD